MSKEKKSTLQNYLAGRLMRNEISLAGRAAYEKTYKLAIIVFLFNVFMIGYRIYTNQYIRPEVDILFVIFVITLHLGLTAIAFILSKEIPSDKKERIDWFYKAGVAIRIIKISMALLITYAAYYAHNEFVPLDYTYFVLFLGGLGYLIFSVITFCLILFPKYIINGYLTGLGTGFRILGVILFMHGTRLFMYQYLNVNYLFSMISVFVLWFIYFQIFFFDYYLYLSSKGLNSIQVRVLDVVKPVNLYKVFSDYVQQLNDRDRANQLMRELVDNDEYGVMEELIHILEKEKTSKLKWVLGIISVIVIFIITSSLEGLIQDLINEDIKLLFCEYMRVFC